MAAVSVLMGTFNEKKIVAAQAIESILHQTFADFEFIICDDGSEPDFYHWLKIYCKRDRRIRLLRNRKNQGFAAVLNQCLKAAVGAYIARMDADDLSDQERLAKQYSFLESHPEYALVGCHVRMIANENTWGVRILEKEPDKYSFLKTSPFVHPAVMIRKDVMEELGGYSQASWVQRAEDYDFFMRLYGAGYSGCNLQEILFSYREELSSYQKRTYRARIHECLVRFYGFQHMGILKGNFRYVAKPLIAGLVPAGLMYRIKTYKYHPKRCFKG